MSDASSLSEDELMELNRNWLVGRALDNRMGGFMIAEVARRLSEEQEKATFRAIHREFGAGGDWFKGCRNDFEEA